MFVRSDGGALAGLFVLSASLLLVSGEEAFSQVLAVVAEAVSAALNVLFHNVSHVLQAAGVHGVPVPKVSPDGLIFVTQWLILALIGYWLISLVFGLVASALRRSLWLLKVGVALLCFGLIVSDRSVDADTTAIRLAALVCACVLLGVGTGRGSAAADRTAQLEQQLKTLERRLGDMERWSRTEE
ncbi:transmembrane protein 109 [Etheostoma cragini]|uniref:transmembrane protein 109 n=1 Tax=Etheostoma cragini TaxID=417921 RepID=UPI00155EA51A|nr:transmembrane protein 109 [Etheostoma cragini]